MQKSAAVWELWKLLSQQGYKQDGVCDGATCLQTLCQGMFCRTNFNAYIMVIMLAELEHVDLTPNTILFLHLQILALKKYCGICLKNLQHKYGGRRVIQYVDA